MSMEERMERAIRIILGLSPNEDIPADVYDQNILGEERSINDVMTEYKDYEKDECRYLIKNEPHPEVFYISSEFQNIWEFISSAQVMTTLISHTSLVGHQMFIPYKISVYDLDAENYKEPMDIKINVKMEWNGKIFGGWSDS